jgi:hypothetical protein
MSLPVISKLPVADKGTRREITCLTCKLKGCLGHCRFEVVNRPKTAKAA